MDVVPSVVAVLDTNRGVMEVAMRGVGFLRSLSVARENQVTP
jgi:hypothetical protein